ncbi:MAG: hypothetical protein ABR915_20500, partial [Thermoguttaceae bacterium]
MQPIPCGRRKVLVRLRQEVPGNPLLQLPGGEDRGGCSHRVTDDIDGPPRAFVLQELHGGDDIVLIAPPEVGSLTAGIAMRTKADR